jgi:hypothetical protein
MPLVPAGSSLTPSAHAGKTLDHHGELVRERRPD